MNVLEMLAAKTLFALTPLALMIADAEKDS